MNLLIVEDDENKRNQLRQTIEDARIASELTIQRSLQSGLRSLRTTPPDLVILDMTIPTYDTSSDEPGGQTHIFGGREFLRQMDRFDIAVPVILVTQFETFGQPPHSIHLTDLDSQLRKEHPNTYRGAVYYHASLHGWRTELLTLIASIARHIKSPPSRA